MSCFTDDDIVRLAFTDPEACHTAAAELAGVNLGNIMPNALADEIRGLVRAPVAQKRVILEADRDDAGLQKVLRELGPATRRFEVRCASRYGHFVDEVMAASPGSAAPPRPPVLIEDRRPVLTESDVALGTVHCRRKFMELNSMALAESGVLYRRPTTQRGSMPYYQPVDEKELRRLIRAAYEVATHDRNGNPVPPDDLSPYEMKGKIDAIYEATRPVPDGRWDPNPEMVFFTTGQAVNIRTGEVVDPASLASPDGGPYMARAALPFPYDPSATAPHIRRFLAEMLGMLGEDGGGEVLATGPWPADDVRVTAILEMMAHAIMARKPNIRALFLLQGVSARNGKSVILELLRRMMPVGRHTSIPLSRVGKDFELTSNEADCLANIATENSQPDYLLMDISIEMLKKLGEYGPTAGTIRTRRIYGKPENVRFNMTQVFATNKELPPGMVDDPGINDRIQMILFDRRPEKEDPGLIDKLTTNEELSGLFNLLVPHMVRLLDEGRLLRRLRPSDMDAHSGVGRKAAWLVGLGVTRSHRNIRGGAVLLRDIYGRWARQNDRDPDARRGRDWDEMRAALAKNGYLTSAHSVKTRNGSGAAVLNMRGWYEPDRGQEGLDDDDDDHQPGGGGAAD